MKILSGVVAVLVVLMNLLVAPGVAHASVTIINGTFEDGDLSGWLWTSATGGVFQPVRVIASGGYSAHNGQSIQAQEGSYFARLKPGDPGSFTTLYQTFTADPGDAISGYALFDAGSDATRDDYAEVRILQSGAAIATVYTRSITQVGAGLNTGWQNWSFNSFPAHGTYTLEARITNAVGYSDDSILLIDNVTSNALPNVEAGGPYTVNEGDNVQLSGSATTASGQVAYSWDLNNDGTYETLLQNPTFHAIDGSATISVTLKATDPVNGVSVTDTATIYVLNVAPVVEAGQDGSINLYGSFVASPSFTDLGPDNPWSMSLDFGDGAVGTVANPLPGPVMPISHQYMTSGNFTITVTVTDKDGGIGSDFVHVNVIGPAVPPVFLTATSAINQGQPSNMAISQTGPGTYGMTVVTVGEGQALHLQITANDPRDNSAITMSIIDLRKQIAAGQWQPVSPTAIGIALTYGMQGYNGIGDLYWTPGYCDSGEYEISIKGQAAISQAFSTFNFHIAVHNVNQPAVASAGGPYSVVKGDSLTLAGSATDADAGCANEILTFSWDLNHDGVFGDATGASPILTWQQLAALGLTPGQYTITLRVTDAPVNDPTTTVTVTATTSLTVIPAYSLTVGTVGNGTVSKNPDQALYRDGSTVTLTATATPNSGYTFLKWEGDVTGSQNPITTTMNSNKTVMAIFSSKALYPLTVQIVGSGSVARNPDQAGYESGTSVQLTATADPGYVFTGWSGDASGTANPVSVVVNKGLLVTATFMQTFPLTVNKVGSGNVTIVSTPPVLADGTYLIGSNVTLTTAADPGFIFTGWSGDLVDTASPASLVMNKPMSVTATFTAVYGLTVNVNVNGSGTVSQTSDKPPVVGGYLAGTTVTLTAAPAPGYVLDHWDGATPTGALTATVMMDATKTVTAYFVKARYVLTVVASGGSVLAAPAPGTDGKYEHGATVTLTASNSVAGYVFDHWDGATPTGVMTATVLMDGPKTVTAYFVKLRHNLTVIAVNGSVAASPQPGADGKYEYGTTVTLTATAATGYVFDHWAGVTSANATTATVYIDGSRTVTAYFVKARYVLTIIANGGSVTQVPLPTNGTYEYGTTVTLTAAPSIGYKFDHWEGVTTASGTNATVLMDGPKTVTAVFAIEESLLIKHLHINWDKKDSGCGDGKDGNNNQDDHDDKGGKSGWNDDKSGNKDDDCRSKYDDYQKSRDQRGDNDKNTIEKFNTYLQARESNRNGKSDDSDRDAQNVLSKYDEYTKTKAKYGDSNQKTKDKLADYVKARDKAKVSCAPPSPPKPTTPPVPQPAHANFEVYGRLKVPAGISVTALQTSAVVTLTISNGTVTDTLVFRSNGRGDVKWVGQDNESLTGVGLDVEKMTIWWAPKGSNWDGMAGFHIDGELRMPAGIDGSTRPPTVTLTISIPKIGGGNVLAVATVTCDVIGGQDTVWQYNAHTGWPAFPYDVIE